MTRNTTCISLALSLLTAIGLAQTTQPAPDAPSPRTTPAPGASSAAGPATSSAPTQPLDIGGANVLAQERLAKRVARRSILRGAEFLLKAQNADGAWAPEAGPGVSALVLKALIQEPTIGPKHEAVKRGVAWLLKSQRDDGGVYGPEGLLKNYESSVVLGVLAALQDSGYKKQIGDLQKFLTDNQWDEGESKSVDDAFYGGAGYGQHKRPDLSNTQMMLEALHDSGLSKDDPAYKKALVFIRRCQMLAESNDQPFAKGSGQGGFIYSPADGGESKAGTLEVSGRSELRCYGSMTYAGFKSLLFCGLDRKDPKVQAAYDWIRRYWTLKYNPNMPAAQSEEGLYYYYHVLARALEAYGEPTVVDGADVPHNWRHELIGELQVRQKPDGSWVNDADRWMEGLPPLTTAYAVLALQATYKFEK